MTDGEAATLRDMLDAAGAEWLSFGDVPIVATFGEYEAEYAAIHRYVAVLHRPQRGVLRLTGSESDRRDFLHRMTTQDIRSMTGGGTRRALQLNDKGRIVADMLVHHGDADTWLELDTCDAPALRTMLDGRIFSEDIALEDWSRQRVAVSLLGPGAWSAAGVSAFEPGVHHVLQLSGHAVTAYRRDVGRSPGLHLLVPAPAAGEVYRHLLDAAGFEAVDQPDADYAARRRQSLRGRPIGWLAYNTARIEAGEAMFHIDFGPDSLPQEIGPAAFAEAVHLSKGCYLGQEIVARMHNLGHPKKLLVAVRFTGDALPTDGSQVFDLDRATAIGAITSSAISPLQSNAAIGLAMMKWGRHTPGTRFTAAAEGQWCEGVVA
jgi:folate-binding protein YgfZ